jgi:integrase/recombinase XerC/integrase/recombinase XerD
MPAVDLDPASGRARLSYRRAEEIFAAAGQRMDPGTPWTLHRLRHSGIASAVEQGWNVAQIRAKSRHSSLRALEIYTNPSAQHLADLTAALDPLQRAPRDGQHRRPDLPPAQSV